MTKNQSFEEFLAEYWMEKLSEGRTKDQCETAYEGWISNLDIEELIEFGQRYGDLREMQALKTR